MTADQTSLLDLMEPKDSSASLRLKAEMDSRLRQFCLDRLAELREAETIPWSAPIARCNRAVFPIHVKLFPPEEAARMQAELLAHFERLGWKG